MSNDLGNMGTSYPTGNVVMDPDKTWNEDGSKKDPAEWNPVNPMNINEDTYTGKQPKGRRKFGKIFDDEAQATIAEEVATAKQIAADTEDVLDPEVAHLIEEDDAEQLGNDLNTDDVGKLLVDIKVLAPAAKSGDADADKTLLDITQAEYSRPDGGRQRIKGALSAHGYKKPGR